MTFGTNVQYQITIDQRTKRMVLPFKWLSYTKKGFINFHFLFLVRFKELLMEWNKLIKSEQILISFKAKRNESIHNKINIFIIRSKVDGG